MAENLTEAPQPSENLKSIYANGFGISLGNCDITVVIQNNGKNLFLLNMSYTVAKTLAQELAKAITTLESATGKPIMTAIEIASLLQAADKAEEKS